MSSSFTLQTRCLLILYGIAVIVVILLTSASLAVAAQSPLTLSSSPNYELARHLEMFVEPAGKLTLAEVVTANSTVRFTPIPGNLNRSYTRDTVWLRTTVIRTAPFPEDAWLRLDPPVIDFVTVYLQIGENPALPSSYQEIRMGDHIPVAGYSGPWRPRFRRDADRCSDLMATGIPVASRPLFR